MEWNEMNSSQNEIYLSHHVFHAHPSKFSPESRLHCDKYSVRTSLLLFHSYLTKTSVYLGHNGYVYQQFISAKWKRLASRASAVRARRAHWAPRCALIYMPSPATRYFYYHCWTIKNWPSACGICALRVPIHNINKWLLHRFQIKLLFIYLFRFVGWCLRRGTKWLFVMRIRKEVDVEFLENDNIV